MTSVCFKKNKKFTTAEKALCDPAYDSKIENEKETKDYTFESLRTQT